MNFKLQASRFKTPLIFALCYLIFAILFTWPLASQITTHGFGINEDSPYHIWHNWWFKYSIFDLHQSPLYTNYIFHPQTIPLTFDANAFVFSALTLPLQPLVGVLTASNIIFLLSFVLSGMGMFYLAKYVLSKTYGSSANFACFLAGLIYAFSPYTLSQAIDGHTNLTTTWIIPLYTLFLIKTLRKAKDSTESPLKSILSKDLFLTGVLLTLQAYNDLTYTAFIIILTGAILFFHALILRKEPKTIVRLLMNTASVGVVSLILFLPVLIPTAHDFRLGINPSAPIWVQSVWSADLLAFFKPSTNSTLFKSFAFAPHQGSIEGTVFLGWAAIALATIAVFRHFLNLYRKRENESLPISNMLSLLFFLTVIFFVLSLGPYLNVNNIKLAIPLPFFLIHKIPLIGGTQEPARLNPFLMMPFAILTGDGLLRLHSFLNRKSLFLNRNAWAEYFLGVLVFCLLILEFLQLPFPTTNLQPPKIYEIIANDPRPVAVLDLPLGFNSGNISLGYAPIGSLQYYQVIHQHPSFRGTVARIPTWAFDYYRELPVIKYLLNPDKPPDEKDLDKELAKKTLKGQLNVGYIIVHRGVYKEKSIPFGKTEDLINNVLGARKIYEENNVVAYKLD